MKQLKRVIRIGAALAVIYGVSTAALYVAMRQSPERFGAIMSRVPNFAMAVLPFEPLWMRARSGSLNVGDQAPDFLLSRLSGAGKVQLSAELREHPVVLIFGSYTWPPFRREVPALNRLFDDYRNRIGFYVVYILEAHPTDLWQMAANVREGVLFRSPRTNNERTETASACVRNLGIRIPALLDGIDNRTERAYTAWPDRLYLIGQDGRILFKTRPGPFGFSAKGLDEILRGLESERSARNIGLDPGHD